jgi:hypothetical protein
MLKKVIAKVSAFALALTIVGGGGAIAKEAYKNTTGSSYGITVEAAGIGAPVIVCHRISVAGVLYSGRQIRLVRQGNNYHIFIDGRFVRTAPMGVIRILG